MNITWLIIIGVIAAVAAAGSLVALRGRAQRRPVDLDRIALLRDRLTERESRRLVEQVDARRLEETQARGRAPQRQLHPSTPERIWAGGL